MKLSHTMSATTFAAMLAASGYASAALTYYEQSGYITSSNCDTVLGAASLAAGQPSNSVLLYPGVGLPGMTVVSPGTAKPTTTAAGSAVTNTCVQNGSPASAPTLKGSTPNYTCHADGLTSSSVTLFLITDWSVTKPPAVAGHGSISTTNSTAANTVRTVSTLGSGPFSPLCTFTTDATWVKK